MYNVQHLSDGESEWELGMKKTERLRLDWDNEGKIMLHLSFLFSFVF